MMLPKHKALRDAKHLAFIRTLACIVCGLPGPSEAAHLRIGHLAGTGQKPPDWAVVPLCRRHHAEEHDTGPPLFWRARLSADPVLAARAMHALARSLYAGEKS